MIDTHTRDRLLRRIGLSEVPAADAAGLLAVHRAFVTHVPFEDISVQLGESAPLDPPALVARLLEGGRGGYCFEVNTVLALLLESLGFAVQRREGIVGDRGAHARGEATNHLALVVHTRDNRAFIAEAGAGDGPVDPLPLREGRFTAGAFGFVVAREGKGWWVGQAADPDGAGFRFADRRATLEDFQPHHERLSRHPDSRFVRTLVVQQPHGDRVVTLRARTLTSQSAAGTQRRVLDDQAAFATALYGCFGIDAAALGEERLGRLWRQATEQHAAHQATVTA